MVKNVLNRKLFRDMWKVRMQFVAVILLCALGSWIFSGLDAAWRMLELSSQTYFDNQNTADFWVTLNGIDRTTLNRVQDIAGVEDAQARATAEFTVDMPNEPILVVEAYDGAIRINTPLLYDGENLDQSDLRGCLLDAKFAEANHLTIGDRVTLKLDGELYTYIIRGTCQSAEFASVGKSSLLDSGNYGFALINHRAMEALSLNEMVITMRAGADEKVVEAQLTNMYPDAMVISRIAQRSTHGIQNDADMYRNLSYLFPLLAYAVAAMIVLTTITRMLENQRMQMGTLKSLGYRDGQILRHYLSYAFYPSLLGAMIGLFVGRATLPYVLWKLEAAQFAFPYCLQAPISWEQWAMSLLVVGLSCWICLHTYRKNAREQTAELLRPKAPKAGKKLFLERFAKFWRGLSFNAKMVVRNLFRNKARQIMSLVGVLCCTMLIITTFGLQDSVTYFVGKYYNGTLRYTVRAGLMDSAGGIEGYRKRLEAKSVEGVMERNISARAGNESRTMLLTVLEDDQRLMYLGKDETYAPLPTDGVMLTDRMAELLKLSKGDMLEIWLPGDDEPIVIPVMAVAYLTMGQGALMSRSVWESCKKGDFRPTALLIDQPTEGDYTYLNDLDELDTLKYPPEQYNETLKVLSGMLGVFSLMSGVALGLAFVVLYNMGMLNFTERYREYATLKVLGYHQKEIKKLMATENNILTGFGVLLGIVPGLWLTDMVLVLCANDTTVFSSTVKPLSIVLSCVGTYLFSYLITRLLTHKVKTINMVEALKSVE